LIHFYKRISDHKLGERERECLGEVK